MTVAGIADELFPVYSFYREYETDEWTCLDWTDWVTLKVSPWPNGKISSQ